MIQFHLRAMSIKRRTIIGSLLAPQRMLDLSSKENIFDVNNPALLCFCLFRRLLVVLYHICLVTFQACSWRVNSGWRWNPWDWWLLIANKFIFVVTTSQNESLSCFLKIPHPPSPSPPKMWILTVCETMGGTNNQLQKIKTWLLSLKWELCF